MLVKESVDREKFPAYCPSQLTSQTGSFGVNVLERFPIDVPVPMGLAID